MRFTQLSDWLRWQEGLHPNPIDLGLTRAAQTLQRLGWQQPTCPVITVAGTNGKGSCVALLASILGSAGYRVGCFTSPHIHSYNERITLAGERISDATLIAAFERIDAARGADTLTFFEFNALAALLSFEAAALDAIVLEVGLGGRLDAVNIVDADVALVSSIALDHCEWLGNDVEAIGREKAGILRKQRPAVFGARAMPASIRQVAEQLGAPLQQLGVDFDYQRDAQQWHWRGRQSTYAGLPLPALAGAIQFDNASAVLAVLECLRERLPLPRSAIDAGLRTVALPGRFQCLARAPEWRVDVAHNPAAAATLASLLQEHPCAGRTLAVVGVLGDKDIEGIAAALAPCIDDWIVAGLAGARTLPVEQVAQRLQHGGARILATAPSVAEACSLAAARAAPQDRVIAFGSFLTVAAALDWFEQRTSGRAISR